ncbi:MAG: LamG domain-containing protein, partial [Candidatus ainarchaeum sp.]|nr:LamG domain-containing protein [Candidatus ainarchaeum sp.]
MPRGSAVLVFLILFFGAVFSLDFSDTAYSDFNSGSSRDINTTLDGNVILAKQNDLNYFPYGDFNSRVFDAGSDANWQSMLFSFGGNYAKALPDNAAIDTDANMSGNVRLYHLNEGSGATSFTDSSGGGNNGGCSSCPAWRAAGKFGGAYTFDGTNNVITANTVTLGSSAAFEVWAMHTAANPRMLWNHPANAGVTYFDLWHINNSIYLNTGDSYGNPFKVPGTSANVPQLAPNSWHHYVTVLDAAANSAFLYVDGRLYGTASYKNPAATTTRVFSIGGPVSYRWAGSIDEFAIYNRALGLQEIRDHYKRGALRLNLKVRSCNDSACDGESFVGPSGASDTNFSDSNPAWDLNVVADNRYFQYNAVLETDDLNSLAEFTPKLLGIAITYSQLNLAPDINITAVENYPDNAGMPVFSYFRDGNLVIDFNLVDSDSNNFLVDINYSTVQQDGSGTPIIIDFNLTANPGNCDDLDFTDSTGCSWEWDTSQVPDGNYYILIKATDIMANVAVTGFDASGNSLMIDNTKPSTRWDGNHNAWQGFDANISLACDSGNGSGCGPTKYRLDADGGAGIAWGDWQAYDSNIFISADGNWALDFNSTDAAGNIGDTNEMYVLIGPKGILKTFDANEPESFFGLGRRVAIRFETNLGVQQRITITDPTGTVLVRDALMLDSPQPDFNGYDYNYDINGAVGWYDVKIGSQFFDNAFYRANVWQGRYVDNAGATFPMSFDMNVSEPGVKDRWFNVVDARVDFNYNADGNSVRVLDYNGTDFLEIPSRVYNQAYSNNYTASANLVFLVTLGRNSARHYFVNYSQTRAPTDYGADLNAIRNGFLFDFNNSAYKARIDANKGGTGTGLWSKTGNNSDLGGNTSFHSSPAAQAGLIIYSGASLSNANFSLDADSSIVSKLRAYGVYGTLDYNITYTFYAKAPYFLMDINASSRGSEIGRA